MSVNYNNFSKSFAQSRKNMKWAELEYFFSKMIGGNILDIGCGSGRLVEQYEEYFGTFPEKYLGIDLSRGLLDEAITAFPNMDFLQGNMLNISSLTHSYTYKNIFLIASFHHLRTLEERQLFLHDLYQTLEKGGKVYMTNWALNSSFNHEKYKTSQVSGSKNIYESLDYFIKIGKEKRYYHCFSLDELEYLSQKAGFGIIENRLFTGDRNIITILEK